MSADRRMSLEELRAGEEAWVADVLTAQSAWHTPRPVLDAIVSRVAGRPPTTCERLQAGQSNETYICDAGGVRIVVRVAHRGGSHFEQERWAITAARSRGVPAPEVLLIAHEQVGGELVSFCVERHVPGISLGKLARRRGREDALVGIAVRHAGELLAAIHDVPTRGFGELQADGSAPLADWPAFLTERLGPVPTGQPPEVARALATLGEAHAQLAETSPRLVHFDFEPSHLLVDERSGEITGVIDFESAKSGDPAYDFAQWDVIHDAYAPAGALIRGYAGRVPLAPEFARRRLLSEIHYRVRDLVRGTLPSASIAVARTRLDLAVDALESWP